MLKKKKKLGLSRVRSKCPQFLGERRLPIIRLSFVIRGPRERISAPERIIM